MLERERESVVVRIKSERGEKVAAEGANHLNTDTNYGKDSPVAAAAAVVVAALPVEPPGLKTGK